MTFLNADDFYDEDGRRRPAIITTLRRGIPKGSTIYGVEHINLGICTVKILIVVNEKIVDRTALIGQVGGFEVVESSTGRPVVCLTGPGHRGTESIAGRLGLELYKDVASIKYQRL